MFPTNVGSLPQLCKSDSLPLPLTDQVAFKLRERSHDTEQEVGHRRIFSGEDKVLFFEPNVYTALRQAEHDLAKVVQVAGQPVHRVTYNRALLH